MLLIVENNAITYYGLPVNELNPESLLLWLWTCGWSPDESADEAVDEAFEDILDWRPWRTAKVLEWPVKN